MNRLHIGWVTDAMAAIVPHENFSHGTNGES